MRDTRKLNYNNYIFIRFEENSLTISDLYDLSLSYKDYTLRWNSSEGYNDIIVINTIQKYIYLQDSKDVCSNLDWFDIDDATLDDQAEAFFFK